MISFGAAQSEARAEQEETFGAAQSEARAEQEETFFVALDGHGSLLSDLAGRSLLNPTVGWSIKGGYRPNQWGVFLQLEQDSWFATETSGKVVSGAFNVALGGEFRYADDFLRTSLAIGSSTLLFDTALDEAGQTGVFMELRPTGLRWQPASSWFIAFDPLGVAIVAPVLSGIPLIQIEYRTSLGVEYAF